MFLKPEMARQGVAGSLFLIASEGVGSIRQASAGFLPQHPERVATNEKALHRRRHTQ